MDLIKLLEIANPKQVKKTINDIITEVNTLGDNLTHLSDDHSDLEETVEGVQNNVDDLYNRKVEKETDYVYQAMGSSIPKHTGKLNFKAGAGIEISDTGYRGNDTTDTYEHSIKAQSIEGVTIKASEAGETTLLKVAPSGVTIKH